MGKKTKWKKFRPDSNEVIEGLLHAERKLTARWYSRISGEIPWQHPGEREDLNRLQDDIANQIDHLIGRKELDDIGIQ